MWKQSRRTLFRGRGSVVWYRATLSKTDSTADHTSESSFSKPQKKGVV